MSKKLVVVTALLTAAALPVAAATIRVSTTIRVTSGTYNGQGNTYVSNGLGDGGQGESQQPIFRVENGATLTNAKIGAPAADGVHCYNGCILHNIHWLDVGEDAATKKSGTARMKIDGGSSVKAADKVFQVNAGGEMTANNHVSNGFSTFMRQNGGTGFCATLNVTNCRLSNGSMGVRTDSSCSTINLSGTTFTNVTTRSQKP